MSTCLEKTLKALYLNRFGKEAPRTHNLPYLAVKLDLKLEAEKERIFLDLTSYYIESRYPDYKKMLASSLTKTDSKKIMQETREIFQWLSSQL